MEDFPTTLGITHSAYQENEPFTATVTIDERHTNYHGDCHGGMLYSLCMEAVAAYTHAAGKNGPGMDGTIHYYRGAHVGDRLTAVVEERKSGRTVGNYAVSLYNQENRLLADASITVMYSKS